MSAADKARNIAHHAAIKRGECKDLAVNSMAPEHTTFCDSLAADIWSAIVAATAEERLRISRTAAIARDHVEKAMIAISAIERRTS